jgi:hypothetical protein
MFRVAIWRKGNDLGASVPPTLRRRAASLPFAGATQVGAFGTALEAGWKALEPLFRSPRSRSSRRPAVRGRSLTGGVLRCSAWSTIPPGSSQKEIRHPTGRALAVRVDVISSITLTLPPLMRKTRGHDSTRMSLHHSCRTGSNHNL